MGINLGLKTWILLEIYLVSLIYGAVVPPPWADPELNPCAKEPRGWQLLFWPPDGQCYKIFQLGHPCPDGMELSPATSRTGKELYAECRCPPKYALSPKDGKCYQQFSIGPCPEGSYFGPDTYYKNNVTKSNQQLGTCKLISNCPNPNSIFWIKDGKCYQKLTRGPCPKGQLLTLGDDMIPICTCNKEKELRLFRADDGKCYQYFTRGPCKEMGFLFMPDKSCGCHSFLPHYHDATARCYELGTIGPCAKGEMFTVLPKTSSGGCVCKPGNIRYLNNTSCHRPFTQGPCEPGHMLVNSTSCIPQPCPRGFLYFASKGKCYKVGSRGPCAQRQIVSFDFETRPSVDGVSYNGLCMCGEKKNCSANNLEPECDRSEGLIRYGDKCYKLYSQGPCQKGAYLVPQREGKELLTDDDDGVGVCECLPGNIRRNKKIGETRITECLSSTIVLTEFLKTNITTGQVHRWVKT